MMLSIKFSSEELIEKVLYEKNGILFWKGYFIHKTFQIKMLIYLFIVTKDEFDEIKLFWTMCGF